MMPTAKSFSTSVFSGFCFFSEITDARKKARRVFITWKSETVDVGWWKKSAEKWSTCILRTKFKCLPKCVRQQSLYEASKMRPCLWEMMIKVSAYSGNHLRQRMEGDLLIGSEGSCRKCLFESF